MGVDKDGEVQARKYKSACLGNTRGWESPDPEYFSAAAERLVRELNQLLVAETA